MMNNLDEYSNPVLYDLENQTFEPDGPFFLKLARDVHSPVLEIGCGTGRITIPLAQSGIEIVGLDVVPSMLERARSKSIGLPVRWIEADARSFSLNEPFALIFESGAAFQHMLTRADQEAMLARVREHLAPNGRFILSVLVPGLGLMTTDESEQEWFIYQDTQGREVRVSGTQHYDAFTQIKTETAYRRWSEADGRVVTHTAPLQLRYTFPQELETMLHYNGFRIIERYGDWNFTPPMASSKKFIVICQAMS